MSSAIAWQWRQFADLTPHALYAALARAQRSIRRRTALCISRPRRRGPGSVAFARLGGARRYQGAGRLSASSPTRLQGLPKRRSAAFSLRRISAHRRRPRTDARRACANRSRSIRSTVFESERSAISRASTPNSAFDRHPNRTSRTASRTSRCFVRPTRPGSVALGADMGLRFATWRKLIYDMLGRRVMAAVRARAL